jgi:hypothetical protein
VHSLDPVLQPVVVHSHGLHEGVEGVVLPPVPVELRAQLDEAVVSHSRPTLQLLQAAVGNTGENLDMEH